MATIFSRHAVPRLVCALLSGCQGSAGSFDGRWVGAVSPSDPSCGATTQGMMSIGQKTFGFDPFRGTTIINGTLGPDGHLTGRLVRQGSTHQDMSISFDGVANEPRPGEATIAGVLASGRCQWQVTLHRDATDPLDVLWQRR